MNSRCFLVMKRVSGPPSLVLRVLVISEVGMPQDLGVILSWVMCRSLSCWAIFLRLPWNSCCTRRQRPKAAGICLWVWKKPGLGVAARSLKRCEMVVWREDAKMAGEGSQSNGSAFIDKASIRNSENRSPKIFLSDSDLTGISLADVSLDSGTFTDEISATSFVIISMQSITGTEDLSLLGSTKTRISLASFL